MAVTTPTRYSPPFHLGGGGGEGGGVERVRLHIGQQTKDGERSSGGLALIIGARSLADLSRDSVA